MLLDAIREMSLSDSSDVALSHFQFHVHVKVTFQSEICDIHWLKSVLNL